EGEERELRPDVESHLDEESEAAIDVERAPGSDVEGAGGVSLVLHGKHGRREEWRAHLSAMRVSGEHPAAHAFPDRDILRVRVVRQHDRRLTRREPSERRCGVGMGWDE